MEIIGHLDEEQFWTQQRAIEDQIRAEATTFPTYAVTTWDGPRVLGPWERENDVLTSVTLRHGEVDWDGGDVDTPFVEVTTTMKDPHRKALAAMLSAIGLTPMSPEYKRRREAIAATDAQRVTVPVDGVDVHFELHGGAERWWASAQLDEHGVVIEGRRHAVDDVILASESDMEPYLEGLRTRIRAARGE
ncbi:hypothetical protein ASG56_08035 [Rhodococcus sp. Leaf7]|uniref:hypothetical protein n=1 Tax=unclassified Rhodococcus (in: high G+C Gram-positive bacteria) TaxID=192944 RepID=UPI0006F94AC6|nr:MULTISPECIES: hypothetical protein [unclassified Rhodococcus (in: high G+C Gram-positive bacteria)]KQU07442.1 hypothetical protein ASG56_08035 [Rhodococcus sp. Leaf7]KQU42962.1 hypothetical protein ASG64_08035 [Rhodococcus sp. Leaf247]